MKKIWKPSVLNKAILASDNNEWECPVCLALPNNKNIGLMKRQVNKFGFICSENKTHYQSAMELFNE